MEGLVTALQNIITTDNFFSTLSSLIPIIGGALLFAFAYRVVRRIVSGAQKGKAKI